MKAIIFALARTTPTLAYWLMVMVNFITLLVLNVVARAKIAISENLGSVLAVPFLTFTGGFATSGALVPTLIVTAVCTSIFAIVNLVIYTVEWLSTHGLFAGMASTMSAAHAIKEARHA